MSEAWIETFTGKAFNILDPQPDMVCLEDIAHSLSMLPRYTGHTKFPYPVAQHLRVGSYFIPDPYKYDYFCHDFSEAYLNDMSRPLKHFTKCGKEYRKIERRVQLLLSDVFGFSKSEPKAVKLYDNRMLYTEKFQLKSGVKFRREWAAAEGREPLAVTLVYNDFWTQKQMFLDRFEELKGKR
ncbi:Uncharacterised protein [uncultured archaeon]|nr:Uncharacterised protein [uncultured archaeon]